MDKDLYEVVRRGIARDKAMRAESRIARQHDLFLGDVDEVRELDRLVEEYFERALAKVTDAQVDAYIAKATSQA